MKKNSARILAVLLVLCMVVTLFAGCKKKDKAPESTTPKTETPAISESASSTPVSTEPEPENNYPDYPEKQVPAGSDAAASYTGGDTLLVAYDPFSSKFSPFFASSGYDQDVVSMTGLGLLTTDREGNPIYDAIDGETRSYNGKDYTYNGIADLKVIENEDGTVDYDFNLATNVKWQDGTPVTIDDVIYSMYVYADPTYDGASTFYAIPIEGMEEYRSGMDSLANVILAAGPDAVADAAGAEATEYFWRAFNAAGVKFAQSIADYVLAAYGEEYGAVDFPSAVALWGFEANDAEEMWAKIVEKYGYDISDDGINKEVATDSIGDLLNAELGDRVAEYAKGVQTGESAPNISGIIRMSDHSVRVHTTKVDAPAIYHVGVTVVPMSYYGDPAEYDYANNKFGFTKGDLSKLREEKYMSNPMGGGPYKFVSFKNGTVTFEANENYFKGTPKIKTVLFQEIQNADRISGVESGNVDCGEIAMSVAVADVVREKNKNGELVDGDVIHTSLVDNLGYGYVGINALNVKVGSDSGSEESKNLRKALMTVLAVYRDTSVASFYGELASVIEYPISNTSWAAPRPTDEGYKRAYSVDVDGNDIYTADMTEPERYEAALKAALGFFEAAGYTVKDGKLTAAPEGAKLEYELIIPGDGTGNHPAFSMVTDAHNALETIGMNLIINDPADSNELWDKQDANLHELWAAAWGSTVDPDMYQVYHSSNIIGAVGGTGSNKYNITSDVLDNLIMEGRSSADQAYRKAVYTDALKEVMDWGVELPTYQRKNAIIFSAERVNVSTITPDITPFWGWMSEVETLEMN